MLHFLWLHTAYSVGTPWQLAYGILPGIPGIPPHLTPQVPRNKGRVQQVPGTYGRYSCVTIFSGSLYTLERDALLEGRARHDDEPDRLSGRSTLGLEHGC